MNATNNQLKTHVKQKLATFLIELSEIEQVQLNLKCSKLRQGLLLYLQSILTGDKTLGQNLIQCTKQLSYIEYIPKTKGRLCGGLLAKGQKAYKCYDCMTQQNSVLCQKCFQLDKHIGHDFERFQVFGGCCDCGDIQKWKQTGFCNEHSKDEVIEIILDQEMLDNFLKQHIYAFKLLMEMYCKFVQFEAITKEQTWNITILPVQQRAKDEMLERTRKVIEFYGTHFFQELVQFNKIGKYANAMTSHFFDQKLTIPFYEQGEIKSVTKDIFSHMFTMLKFKDVPEKICDLCITLFPMVDFREKVTLMYIQCYNKDNRFPTSGYTHLSSQLLTSHLMITKLIKQGRIHALSYYPTCNNQEEVQKLAQGFLRYYYDMKYLSKLYGNASVQYFKLHAQEKKFVNLGEYRKILNVFPRAIDYYGLDQIFLDKMLFVIKVFQKDETLTLQNQVLRQLYQYITTDTTLSTNKFRPQERFLTLIIFNKVKGNLDLLQDYHFMLELFECLGVKDFKKEVQHLMRNLNSILMKASEILQNTTLVHQNYTFYSFYFKKSQKLFNLDAILLKILYKMVAFYNRHQKHQQIRFDQLLIKQCRGYEQRLKQLQQRSEELDQQETHLDQVLKFVKTTKNYISFVSQCLFSDLPQLAIMCALQPTERELKQCKVLTKMPLQNLARHYYLQLLQSEQTNKVMIKSFKANCELFFKEEEVFKQFVSVYKDSVENMKLAKPSEEGNKISQIYFKSLNNLPANKYMGPHNPPYYRWNNQIKLDYLLQTIEKIVSLVQEANKKAIEEQDIAHYIQEIQQDIEWNNSNNEFVMSQDHNQIQNVVRKLSGDNRPRLQNVKFKVGDIPQLLVELWKITMLAQTHKAQYLLKSLLEKDWINKELVSLGPEMLNKIKCEKDKQVSLAQQKQKKQQQRRRLQEKRKMIKAKMNQASQAILKKQAEIMIQQNKNQHLCSLCKENTSGQHLSLLGFVAFRSQFSSQNNQQLVAIFDTCGHAVHKSCLINILNKNSLNKIYSICPLCKNPTNIQLPLKEQYSLGDRDTLSSSLQKIYSTLQYPYKELDVILRSSLVYEILFKGFMLSEMFQKNITIYKILYQIYLQQIYSNPPHFPNNIINIENQTHIVKKVLSLIDHMFISKDIQNEKDMYRKLGFSEQLISKGISIIKKLKNQNHNSYILQDPPQINNIKNQFFYPTLQKNLASMNSKYRGKCEQCGLITNQQVICMNCPSFVTCSACQKMKPSQHSRKSHFGVNVFVKTATGEVIYFMRNRFWKFPSIYEDYMGRAYSGIAKQRQHYELNETRLQQVKKDIYLCRIQQKVRYKENETKQVNHQQIF